MAKRRMLSIPILETDKFYSLTSAAQALYVHLNLNADDDGVVDRVKLITNKMHIRKSSYTELVLGGYIIELDEGLVAITHWHQHNQIRKERYIKGEYLDKISALSLQENGRFSKGSEAILGDKSTPQDSIDKDRKDKKSIEKGKIEECKKEEKREEKENTITQSFLHTRDASLTDEKMTDNSLPPDNNAIAKLVALIKLYFMKHRMLEYSDKFIEYCSSNNWQWNSEPITTFNFQTIIEEWMSKK